MQEQSEKNLLEVGEWLKVNGDAIYNTRKWKVTHKGPTKINMSGTNSRAAEGFKAGFTPRDFWFTQKGDDLYVIAIEYPEDKILIKSLGKEQIEEVKSVSMLGNPKKIKWEQTSEGLQVKIGNERPNQNGYALRVEF